MRRQGRSPLRSARAMPCTGSENQDRGFVEDARSPPWDPARSRLMNSLDTTRREFLEAAAMTGGAFMGGQLMPEVVSSATAQSSTAQDAAMPAQLDVVLRVN